MGYKTLTAIFCLGLSATTSAAVAQADPDREPGPLWGAEMPRKADAVDSYTFYPVAIDSMKACRHAGKPTEDPALLEACRAGDDTYRRRVHHMVAGMNLPDDTERMAHCRKMAALVHDDFQHIEGRRRGFAIRSKPDLERACANRAFRLSGFYGLTRIATAISPEAVQVVVCYSHDQFNDPLVKGDGHILPNGREAIPRVVVETLQKDSDGQWRIRLHVALDADSKLIREGCGALN